jgi:glycosyltransferase involved in cell wall biosynthesis
MTSRMIVDARGLNRKIDGIGRVMRELFQAMSILPDVPEGVFVAGQGAKWPFEVPDGWHLEGNGYIGRKSATLGWLTKAPVLARQYDCNICFGMTLSAPFLPQRTKKVVIAHDVIWRVCPEWFSPSNRLLHNYIIEPSLKNADMVIAVSESTKRDVISILHVPEDRIKVVPLGTARDLAATEVKTPSARFTATGKRLLLCVSSFDPRKNISRLLRACNMLPEQTRKNIEVVLVGTPLRYGGEEVAAEIKYAKLPITVTGKITDSELRALYSDAYIFAYPSLYEGFGLPVLEAMSNGIPVLAGNNSSLPEVVGDAGILCDVKNEVEISGHLANIIENPELADALGERGQNRSAQFSWNRAAESVTRLLQDL